MSADFSNLLTGFGQTRQARINAQDPGALFKDASWDKIGVDTELTSFLKDSLDPDGSKYGGDIEAMKTDLLNGVTARDSSILASLAKWGGSRGEAVPKAQFENLVSRLYESAPNRLLSGDAGDTYQALKSGVVGAVGYDLPLIAFSALTKGAMGIKGLGEVALSQFGKQSVETAGRDAAASIAQGATREAAEATAKSQIMRDAVVSGAKNEAITEGAIFGAAGMASDLASQQADVNRELRGDLSFTDAALSAGLNVGVGAALGGLTGAGGGYLRGRRLQKEVPNAIDTAITAATPPVTPPTQPPEMDIQRDRYNEVKSELENAWSDVDEFRNEVLAGGRNSRLTTDQLDALRGAIRNISNPEEMVASLRAQVDQLEAEGSPDAVRQAQETRLQIGRYERLAQFLIDSEFGSGGLFNATGDIDDTLVRMLVPLDEDFATAMGVKPKGQAPGGKASPPPASPPPGAAPPAPPPAPTPAGPASPPASPPPAIDPSAPPVVNPVTGKEIGPTDPSYVDVVKAKGDSAPPAARAAVDNLQKAMDDLQKAADAQAAKDAADAAAAAATPPGAAPADKPTGTADTNTTANANAAVAGDPPGLEEIEAMAASLSEVEGKRLAYLKQTAEKAGGTVDDIFDQAAEDGADVAAETLAKVTGHKKGAIEGAIRQLAAAVARERSKMSAQSVGELDGSISARASVEAAEEIAGINVSEAEAGLKNQLLSNIGASLRFNQLNLKNQFETIKKSLDEMAAEFAEMAEKAKASKGSGQEVKFGKEEKLPLILKRLRELAYTKDEKGNEVPSELYGLVEMLDPEHLLSTGRTDAALVKLQAAARDAGYWMYAKSIGDILPDIYDVEGFEIVLRSLPSMDAEEIQPIINAYRSISANSMANRIEAVGIERARKEFGDAWDRLITGGIGFSMYGDKTQGYKIDLTEMIDDKFHELMSGILGRDINNTPKDFGVELGNVGKALRDYREELGRAGVVADSQFMDEALRARAEVAIRDAIEDKFRKENAGDFDKIEKMRELRQKDRTQFSRTINQGRNPFFGSMVGNPVLHRKETEEGDVIDLIVTGRRQPRSLLGVRELGRPQGILSDGISDYLGFLWANPRKVFTAAAMARREIYGAAIAASSNRRWRTLFQGQTLRGAEKEVKGRMYEAIQERLSQSRLGSIAHARSLLNSGSITDAQYRARLDGVQKTTGLPVFDYEESTAQALIDAQDRIKSAKAASRERIQTILDYAKENGGILDTAQLNDILSGLSTVMKNSGRDIVGAMKTYESKATSAERGKLLKRRKGKGKEGSEQGSAAKGPKRDAPQTDKRASVLRKIRVGDKHFEATPDSIITLVRTADGERQILLFGKKIGTYDPVGDVSFNATISGLFEGAKPVDGKADPSFMSSLSDLVDSKAFREKFTKELQAGLAGKEVKGKAAKEAPDGSAVPPETSEAVRSEKLSKVISGQEATDGDPNVVGYDSPEMDRTIASFNPTPGRIIVLKVSNANGTRVIKLGVSAEGTGSTTLRQAMDRAAPQSKYGAEQKFTVGTVPAGKVKMNGAVISGGQDWLNAEFRVLGADVAPPNPAVTAAMEATGGLNAKEAIVAAKLRPITTKEASQIVIGKNGDKELTLLDAYSRLMSAMGNHTWGTTPTKQSLEGFIGTLEEIAKLVEQFAPHGIKMPNASRRVSWQYLRQASGVSDPKALSFIQDMLRRLDPNEGGLPYFTGTDNPMATDAASYIVDAEDLAKGTWSGNRIVFGPKGANGDDAMKGLMAAHEIGHWIFMNMLSPMERIEFFKYVNERFVNADGQIDTSKIISSLKNVAEIERALGDTFPDARTKSNEMFAWMWTDYLYSKMYGQADEMSEQHLSMWKRISKYAMALLDMLSGKKRMTDTGLDRLFERIMPVEINGTKYDYTQMLDTSVGKVRPLLEIVEEPNRRPVGSAVETLQKVDEKRRQLGSILFTGGAGNVAYKEKLEEITGHMFGLLMGNKLPSNQKGKKGRARSPASQSTTVKKLRSSAASVAAERKKKGFHEDDWLNAEDFFTKTEQGALMRAIREAMPDDVDSGKADSLAFEAGLNAEEFAITVKASGLQDMPDVSYEYNKTLERRFKELVAGGMTQEDALDRADIEALIAASSYARETYNIDVGSTIFDASTQTRVSRTNEQEVELLDKMARRLYDLMTDTMENLSGQIDRTFGLQLIRNGASAQPTKASPSVGPKDPTLEAIDGEIRKARSKTAGEPVGDEINPGTSAGEVAAQAEQINSALGKENGISVAADDHVKILASRIPHRNPAINTAIGTIIERLSLILSESGYDFSAGEAGTFRITNDFVSMMVAGVRDKSAAGLSIADEAYGQFDSFRKEIREIAEGVTGSTKEGVTDAFNKLSRMVARAYVLSAEDVLDFVPNQADLQRMIDGYITTGSSDELDPMATALIDNALADSSQILSDLVKKSKETANVSSKTVTPSGGTVATPRSPSGTVFPLAIGPVMSRLVSGKSRKALIDALKKSGVQISDDASPEEVSSALKGSMHYAVKSPDGSTVTFTNATSASEYVRKEILDAQDPDVRDAVDERLDIIENGISEYASSNPDQGMLDNMVNGYEAIMLSTFGKDSGFTISPVAYNSSLFFDPATISDRAIVSALLSEIWPLAKKGGPENAQRIGHGLTMAEALLREGKVNDSINAMLKSLNGDQVKKVLTKIGYKGLVSENGDEVEVFSALKASDNFEKKLTGLLKDLENYSSLDDTLGQITLNFGLSNSKPNPMAVENSAVQAGASLPVAKVFSQLWKKNRGEGGLTNEQQGTVRSFGLIQLSENSARIAKAGGEWMRDLIKPVEGTGFFESLYTRMSADLQPMIASIDKLSGRSNQLKKAASEIRRNLSNHSAGIPQTDVEERIVNAIRKNDLRFLSGSEMEVVNNVQSVMRKLLSDQRSAGINVGDASRGGVYLPQRFNTNWLMANREEAIDRLGKWFAKDSGDDIAVTKERATRVINEAINREELQGIVDGASSVFAQAFGDRLYKRSLNISPDDWDSVADLFDNNLKSLLISYTDVTHRRLEWNKRFGIRGHAANTYVNISDTGGTAAVDALTSSSTGIPTIRQDEDGIAEFNAPLFQPLTRDRNEAVQLIASISDRLKSEGKTPAHRIGFANELVALYESRHGKGEVNPHFRKRAEAIVNGLADFGDTGGTVAKHEREFMLKVVGTLGGRPAYAINANEGLRSAARGLRTFNSITLLSGATLASLPDLGLSAIRAASLKSWVKGMVSSAATARGDEANRAALARIGVGIESILNENISGLSGGLSGRVGNAFFWANGLTMWTNAMRQTSALVGFESIKANQAIARRERMAGRDSWQLRRSMRYLRQLGLGYLADAEPLGSLADSISADADNKLAEAIHRFVNEAVFQPNRNDVPLWAQDPIAGMLWQFKSYPVMMGRMVKRSFKEAIASENGKYAGDPRGLMYLLTVGAGLGIGASYIRDVAMGRNQEADLGNPGDAWRSPRDRSLSKIAQDLGFVDKEESVMDNEDLDTAIGWWADGLLSIGALGFLGDLFFQSATKIDNGAFGREQITSRILGPSLGTFQDAMSITEGAVDAVTNGDENGNGKERNAVRKVVRRIPGLGQQQPISEGWVDWVAGEAEEQ